MKTTNSEHREKNMTNNISHSQNDQIRNQKNRDENYVNILSQLEDIKQEIHNTITRHRVNHILSKAMQFETSRY
jgi:uncharacterized protein YpuA (DUF1002 family)